jgi:hypothetical protein
MQVCAVNASLIAQLEALGGLEEWAIYVALHLPDCQDAGSGQGSVRNALVHQLLLRHAPALAASPDKQSFVLERLHLPRRWLAEALSVWARYKRDAEGTTSPLTVTDMGHMSVGRCHFLTSPECSTEGDGTNTPGPTPGHAIP